MVRIQDIQFLFVVDIHGTIMFESTYSAGVEPWTFVQELGEAIFIPAGCPHQVRNLKVYSLLYL